MQDNPITGATNGPIPPTVQPGAPQSTLTAAPVQGQYFPKRRRTELYKTIAIVVLTLLMLTFVGLFAWKYIEWDTVKTDVDSQIDSAVAIAVADNTTKMENEFLEREKYPYRTFAGPADYGSLTFEYPKTWNAYIAKDARTGGDFEAYLNPGEVQPIASDTVYALRVVIRDASFDNEVKRYESSLRNGKLTLNTREVGGTLANVYTGELMNGLHGIVTIFKLRDKTVILQTDAELFAEEYYKLLDTVTFVE